ncbi:MAG: hypothetical protein ACREPI_07340 [Candidatus Dormibacterales bacterium]
MWLTCSAGCGGSLFRVIDPELIVDAEGAYQDHRTRQPGWACLSCGAPAFDLAEVPRAMADQAEAESESTSSVGVDVLCPVCETAVTIGPEMECPNCGAPLEAID